MTRIAAIILAAGESRRMGSPKLVIEFAGQTLLARAISNAQGFADEILVVVGAYAELYRREASQYNITVIDNANWHAGMGATLKTGIAALADDIDAAILMLPDQPFVPVGHFQALLAMQPYSNLVFSRYDDGNLGVPALVRRRHFQDALKLPDQSGAKALIKDTDHVSTVTLKASFARDIDTPQDVQAWLMSSDYE
ncbi:MAG: nucleotidyltransferase family protein [Deinococcota bacterium]